MRAVVNIDIKMNNYILNLELSMNHKFILALADTFKDNGCFMCNSRIGKIVGLSASRVSHIISELVTLGYLTREITYKEDSKEVDKRTIFFNKAIQKVQEVVETVKKAATKTSNKISSKAKQLKDGYTSTKTTVGTQEVEQLTFGQPMYKPSYNGYKKADKRARFNNIASHNWDFDKLELLEQDYIESNVEEEFDLEKLQSRLKNRGGSLR